MEKLDLNLEKIPPQNLEAEMAVIGSMLIEEHAIADAIEMLDAGSFYNEKNRKIFSAILQLFGQHRAIDILTLIEEL